MAKFVFYYAPMGGRKTAEAIMTAYNYEENGLTPLCMSPSIDNRYGTGKWTSRVGISRDVEVFSKYTNLISMYLHLEHLQKQYGGSKYDVIIIDECQFLTSDQVEQLAYIVDYYGVPVLCYGLMTDFKSHLFEGSKRLIEMGAKLREIISVGYDGKKTVMNGKIVDGKLVRDGETIQIGGNELYKPMSRKHYFEGVWKDGWKSTTKKGTDAERTETKVGLSEGGAGSSICRGLTIRKSRE